MAANTTARKKKWKNQNSVNTFPATTHRCTRHEYIDFTYHTLTMNREIITFHTAHTWLQSSNSIPRAQLNFSMNSLSFGSSSRSNDDFNFYRETYLLNFDERMDKIPMKMIIYRMYIFILRFHERKFCHNPIFGSQIDCLLNVVTKLMKLMSDEVSKRKRTTLIPANAMTRLFYFYQPVAKEQLAESNLKSISRVRPVR